MISHQKVNIDLGKYIRSMMGLDVEGNTQEDEADEQRERKVSADWLNGQIFILINFFSTWVN